MATRFVFLKKFDLKTNYFFKRNFNLINQIILKGFENRNKSKCGFISKAYK